MCGTCGCKPKKKVIRLEVNVLEKNDAGAAKNRKWFSDQGVLALNLMSSPGAGKTSLLERTIRDLGHELKNGFEISVIEGDQETENDARRIRETGAKVVQVNTGEGCHLDAQMVAHAVEKLKPQARSLVFIENVGNLVCPALFDLGEKSKVVILSVTEGEDKPLKYPHMFRACNTMILNKIDLLPYVDFDVERCLSYARQINPEIRVFPISATRGDGLGAWYDWIHGNVSDRKVA
jgi:hydrogenase nickel incorporation protein HypB